MNLKKLITHIPLLTLCLLPLSSCSGEKDPGMDGKTVKASFTVVSRGNGTRATTDESPVLDNELINSWWIAFVDVNGGGQVRAIARSGSISPTEMDFVDVTLPAGNYYAYAFANITPEELAEKTAGDGQPGLSFAEGTAAPTHEAVLKCVCGMENNPPVNGNIPMSGWLAINVRENVNEPYAIEVIRMLAKVEFAFTNATGTGITVNGVSFGSLNTGDIPLMPDYADLDLKAQPKGLTAATPVEAIDVPFATPLTLGIGNEGREHFYVRESLAACHPTGHFHFSVKTQREGATQQEVRYALTDKGLAFISRNDYILIPVRLTGWNLRLETLFYPPIGGYPPVIEEVNDNEYYIKFGTQGQFAITPSLIDTATGEKLERSGFTVSVSTPEGDDIFTKAPAVDSVTGEIIGELSAKKGSSAVTVTVSVTHDILTETFTRKVYIIK